MILSVAQSDVLKVSKFGEDIFQKIFLIALLILNLKMELRP